MSSLLLRGDVDLSEVYTQLIGVGCPQQFHFLVQLIEQRCISGADLAKDTTFPFADGDALLIRIDGERLIIEKSKTMEKYF